MKKLLSLALLVTLLSGCPENEEAEQIVGSWCLSENIDILTLSFSSNKIFKTEFAFPDQIVLDHGSWTVRDEKLFTKTQKGDVVHEDVYEIDFEDNKMYLNELEPRSSEYNPIFSYASFFGESREGADEGEMSFTRCANQ